MAGDDQMPTWWKSLDQQAKAAWCTHVDGVGPLTAIMAESVHRSGETEGPQWLVETGPAEPGDARADVWMMSDAFGAFIREQCGPKP
jgi:hypothetical protein